MSLMINYNNNNYNGHQWTSLHDASTIIVVVVEDVDSQPTTNK